MNNKVTKYSDLLRKQADMMDMVEGTELDWWDCVKFKGEMLNEIELKSWDNPQDYEFAVILVEGKPVFIGDMLYDENGIGWTVGFTFDFNNKSWNKRDNTFPRKQCQTKQKCTDTNFCIDYWHCLVAE